MYILSAEAACGMRHAAAARGSGTRQRHAAEETIEICLPAAAAEV